MDKAKPLSGSIEKKDENPDSKNYPIYYVNPLMRTVVRNHTPRQYESIQYNNQKDNTTKWFVLAFDTIKSQESEEAFLSNLEPSEAKDFDGIARKAIDWLIPWLEKFGYKVIPPERYAADTHISGDSAGTTAKSNYSRSTNNSNNKTNFS